MNYWLMKSEPDTYSIDDLKKNKKCQWEGVRNYQARNFMRDDMKKGDLAFFYHSACKEPGIVGVMEVCRESHPDLDALDKKSSYYDPKATKENPRWFMVELKFKEKFNEPIYLKDLKADPKLTEMMVTKKGQRLSIQPVDKKHFKYILKKADAKTKVS